jgi:hypothetical protein
MELGILALILIPAVAVILYLLSSYADKPRPKGLITTDYLVANGWHWATSHSEMVKRYYGRGTMRVVKHFDYGWTLRFQYEEAVDSWYKAHPFKVLKTIAELELAVAVIEQELGLNKDDYKTKMM